MSTALLELIQRHTVTFRKTRIFYNIFLIQDFRKSLFSGT